MALVIVHHTVATVVYYSQCLFKISRIFDDKALRLVEEFFGGCNVEVRVLNDVESTKAVLFDITTENFHVLSNFR